MSEKKEPIAKLTKQYMRHDKQARHDQKIINLIVTYGYEGYAFFFLILEIMSEAPDWKLQISKHKVYAYDIRCNEPDKLLEFITYCCNDESGLFKTDGDWFWSERLIKDETETGKIIQSYRDRGYKSGESRRSKAKANNKKGAKNELSSNSVPTEPEIESNSKVNTLSKDKVEDQAKDLIIYLNDKTGIKYSYEGTKVSDGYIKGIVAQLKSHSFEDCKKVIDFKVNEWLGDPKMKSNLNPTTLFRPIHFPTYLAVASATTLEAKKSQSNVTPWNTLVARRNAHLIPND